MTDPQHGAPGPVAHDFLSGRRPPTMAGRAMIATSHPMATATGMHILQTGGNAVDAALAASAVQAVVDPLMTGVGGDCFALIVPAGGSVMALNGSGCAPARATIDTLRQAGIGDTIPLESPHSVTVPGAISAWCRMHSDHGDLPLTQVFAAAIGYARDGFRVTPRVALDWGAYAHRLSEGARAHFLPRGRAPVAGDHFAQPALGRLLEDIAANGPAAFYRGAAADSMVAHLQSQGGLHSADDFAHGQDAAHWVAPISASYRGYDIHQCPPNGQGLAALLILKIIEGFDIAAMSPADRTHLHAEATKLAYHHRDALIGDPADCPDVVAQLLSDSAIDALRAHIDMTRAQPPVLWDAVEHKDTICLSVVDQAGTAVSFINSVFHPFGSGIFDPATGVLFQNRGASFHITPGHPNAIAPGKRPMHTIIPGMVTQNGRAVMPFGVMGGHYQAAGHAAFLSGMIDLGQTVQQAIDAPRSFALGPTLDIEPALAQEVGAELERRGHILRVLTGPMGGAQAIYIRADGLLQGGSDSRKDGMALGF